MNQGVSFYLLSCLGIALITGIPTILVYGLCRSLEEQEELFGYCAGSIAFLIHLGFCTLSSHSVMAGKAWWLALIPMLSALGGWFHRRSGGASKNWFSAILFMEAVEVISIAIVILIRSAFPITNHYVWLFYQSEPLNLILLGTILAAPVMAPLAVWIWRSLRLRPGVDVPFNTKE